MSIDGLGGDVGGDFRFEGFVKVDFFIRFQKYVNMVGCVVKLSVLCIPTPTGTNFSNLKQVSQFTMKRDFTKKITTTYFYL